jgi:hypothetical protein
MDRFWKGLGAGAVATIAAFLLAGAAMQAPAPGGQNHPDQSIPVCRATPVYSADAYGLWVQNTKNTPIYVKQATTPGRTTWRICRART